MSHRRWSGVLLLLAVLLVLGALPSAPAQAQGQHYFPQTGHFLGGAFRSFWERNGGLDIFGYPISPEFVQNSDGRIVQYFERARFELDVVNDQAFISLGLVGREYLAATGQGFPRVGPVSAPGVRYFPETGHTLRGQFLTFWQQRGGAEIFGLPISEEVVQQLPDGQNYLVQYFERGRFELVGNSVRLGTLASILVPCQLRPGMAPYPPPAGPVPEGDSSACVQQPNLQARVFPNPAPIATTLGFEAHGYKPGERVAIWLNLPNGEARTFPFRAYANADGLLLIGFFTETSDPLGHWSIVGQGLESDTVRVATFTLVR
ncbi:hypothetical protein [Candidatus Viridilinea mediisalina]|uniref:hypothetical protein n=1 Tax=Candidatus Viridilinea mediisalina TaxID=2024553 RepID=UPI000F59DB20|nr:hypothetical protein [Candidatus Viridilinea mediisalina]